MSRTFAKMYQHRDGPYQSDCWQYVLGLAADGQMWTVPLDACRPAYISNCVREANADDYVKRGIWAVYPFDNDTNKEKSVNVNLNIDYAEIISKADRRRAVLKELEEELQMLQDSMEKVTQGLGHLAHLRNLFIALDDEGREMLGAAGVRINDVGGSASVYLNNFLSDQRSDSFLKLRSALGLEVQQ
jgi:hypothetical protein